MISECNFCIIHRCELKVGLHGFLKVFDSIDEVEIIILWIYSGTYEFKKYEILTRKTKIFFSCFESFYSVSSHSFQVCWSISGWAFLLSVFHKKRVSCLLNVKTRTTDLFLCKNLKYGTMRRLHDSLTKKDLLFAEMTHLIFSRESTA